MADIDQIIDFEEGNQSEAETIKMFQALIDSGEAWHLQGSYGRQAMELIEAGLCTLGKEGHRDYWGNYVPSRYEVKSGTKGSAKYVRDCKKARAQGQI